MAVDVRTRSRSRLPGLLKALLLAIVASLAVAVEGPRTLDVYVFWAEGCPHCADARGFLHGLRQEHPRVRVHALEVTSEPANRRIFADVVRHFRIERPGVPLVVIGDRFLLGFDDPATTGIEIRSAARVCLESPCPDQIAPLLNGGTAAETPESDGSRTPVPRTLTLPFFGEVSVAHVSLPWLTVMLAAVDGFNPCAMWTLVFLLSLLVGLRDPLRMWVLGSAFIVTSAAVYYLFMSAWLNLLLLFGVLPWIRLLVATLALGGGGYYLREYFVNPEAVCKLTAPAARRHVFERLRSLAGERSFVLALIGIIMLAFAVNLVELICSAGIPAVYTQVLSLSVLEPWQYHAYLALYILVFMLDDLIVFVVAMSTLQLTGLTGRYIRHAHAIGGAVLIAIGLMLLFKPEWLTFTT